MLSYWQKCLTLESNNESAFNDIALEAMRYQYERVDIYREFIHALKVDIHKIQDYTAIPFLPIQFFKTHKVVDSTQALSDIVFESSGTTGADTSKHYIADTSIYRSSFLHTFHQFYGDPQQYIFICLLPSYIERANSSLVYMCHHLVQESGQQEQAFYLHEYEALNQFISGYMGDRKIFIIGVTFALLDWAEQQPISLSNCIVMDTGGMKGRREEWTRAEVHALLCQRFELSAIHSEYGMTELLSQSYAQKDGIFHTPNFKKILLRDEHDPLSVYTEGTGLINVIDLANIYSCSFIATDDIAKVYVNGSFEVLGRKDNSILRGCSMMSL